MQRTAGTRPDAWLRRVVSSARALCCGWLLAGCLVTDSIEPPAEPSFPLVVTSPIFSAGKVILFDRTKSTTLTIPVEIRDQDQTEPLKMRWRVLTGTSPLPTVNQYTCPENSISGNGSMIREQQNVFVMSSYIPFGLCSVIEVVVSGHFAASCLKNPEPEYFATTTNLADDNDALLGRAYFWVWEVSMDPLTNNERAQQLLSSCPMIPYQTIAPTQGMPMTTAMPPQ